MGSSESQEGGGYGGQNSDGSGGIGRTGGGGSVGSYGGRPREPAGPSIKKCDGIDEEYCIPKCGWINCPIICYGLGSRRISEEIRQDGEPGDGSRRYGTLNGGIGRGSGDGSYGGVATSLQLKMYILGLGSRRNSEEIRQDKEPGDGSRIYRILNGGIGRGSGDGSYGGFARYEQLKMNIFGLGSRRNSEEIRQDGEPGDGSRRYGTLNSGIGRGSGDGSYGGFATSLQLKMYIFGLGSRRNSEEIRQDEEPGDGSRRYGTLHGGIEKGSGDGTYEWNLKEFPGASVIKKLIRTELGHMLDSKNELKVLLRNTYLNCSRF